jgi:hypothetical protein
MAIDNFDNLIAGMTGGAYRIPYQKASLSGIVAGNEASLWRGVGFPAQGAIPTVSAICNNTLLGALPLATRTGTQDRIISSLDYLNSVAGNTLLIEDRLAHMGGLVGNVTTAQTVNVNLHNNLAVNNISARIGNANYSEVEWYLEWYTATGATISTPTAQVTFHDGTTGSVNIWVLGATALPATVAASRRYKLVPTNGKHIRSVESVSLSASTGTAGNFGVTAVRRLTRILCVVGLRLEIMDWQAVNAPEIQDEACVTISQLCIGTTTNAINGTLIQSVN